MTQCRKKGMDKSKSHSTIARSFWDASLSYITSSVTINDHKHYCYKVAVSLDHTVNCMLGHEQHIAVRGFVVNQGKKHRCAAPEGPVLNNLIEPDSLWGKRIKELLDGKDFVRFEEITDTASLTPILPKNYQGMENDALAANIQKLMNKLTDIDPTTLHPVDDRIERVTAHLLAHVGEKLSRETLSDLTFLSYERARHLFAEQKGIPLSRYILWQRLRCVLKSVIQEKTSLTAVIKKYGFSDLSHFNRTFRGIFGFNPSDFLLESRVII